ncbi:MAG: nucleotidyltransferase family protein [Leptolyngbya sp.]|nr:nucleotidyltransferase family protein [Candidatus Melainabacteria bacterium]
MEAKDSPRKVAGVILAAGSSSRFGSPKQLAQIGQSNLIQHAQKVLADASVDELSVILGCNSQLIKQYIDRIFTLIDNINWEEGLASSIRLATQFAREKKATHLMLMVCDQPFVTVQLLHSLLALSAMNSNAIVACKYNNTAGIPAVFPASYFSALLDLKGDRGAKVIINQSKECLFYDFENGEIDIDQPNDLKSLLAIKRFD